MSRFYCISLGEEELPNAIGCGRVVRRCWVNLQCRGVLLICVIVRLGPIAFAVDAEGGCLDMSFYLYFFLCLLETA